VRNMVRAGVSERVAMSISGHKTRSIFDRYHIVAPSDLREAGANSKIVNNKIARLSKSPAPSEFGHSCTETAAKQQNHQVVPFDGTPT
jgi:hypothetical protein